MRWDALGCAGMRWDALGWGGSAGPDRAIANPECLIWRCAAGNPAIGHEKYLNGRQSGGLG
ncbi:hypothetical protein N007_04430 [Alicyclobacillus acidoterrestris ATCC 49025]|nr:hypothetical protein N007_04430 [Alicyclobacillus acidoterrestris ATCC 49025]